jgi:hypothetical protein
MTIARESILLITSFTSACRKPTSYSPRVFKQEEGVVSFPDKDSQNSGEKKSWLMMVQSRYLSIPSSMWMPSPRKYLRRRTHILLGEVIPGDVNLLAHSSLVRTETAFV